MPEPLRLTHLAARVDPPYRADEATMLAAWLDYHRATLAWKCDGLTPEQLCQRSVPPSDLSLLGLVRHMTDVERYWFQQVLLGRPRDHVYWRRGEDVDFSEVAPASAAADLQRWAEECERSRVAAATVEGLDAVAADHSRRPELTLRWILVHMVEEYARHNGHADLLRQAVDGSVGD